MNGNTSFSYNSIPPSPIHDAHIPHQIWCRNLQSSVGLTMHALLPMNAHIYRTRVIQEQRINNHWKVMVISQLPTDAGEAINFSANMLCAPVNKNDGVTIDKISKLLLRYASIINDIPVGRSIAKWWLRYASIIDDIPVGRSIAKWWARGMTLSCTRRSGRDLYAPPWRKSP